MQSDGDITQLLNAVRDGEPGAADRLVAFVYRQLRQLAGSRLKAFGDTGCDATTLVHDAYIRLFHNASVSWQNRHHFFWAAARAMRDILVERARRQRAIKRGGGQKRVPLSEDIAAAREADDLVALDECLVQLESQHPEPARLLMLQFFAGLSRAQIAEATGLSESDVWRQVSFAKSWLLQKLDAGNGAIQRF